MYHRLLDEFDGRLEKYRDRLRTTLVPVSNQISGSLPKNSSQEFTVWRIRSRHLYVLSRYDVEIPTAPEPDHRRSNEGAHRQATSRCRPQTFCWYQSSYRDRHGSALREFHGFSPCLISHPFDDGIDRPISLELRWRFRWRGRP